MLKYILASIIILLLLEGCANVNRVNETASTVISEVQMTQENEQEDRADNENIVEQTTITQSIDASESDKENVANTDFDNNKNPYENYDPYHFWHYYVYEMYRGAVIDELFPELEHHSYTKRNENTIIDINVHYPQVDKDGEFSKAFNNYYINKLKMLYDVEGRFLDYITEGITYNEIGYTLNSCYAYEWSSIYSVFIEETVLVNRTLSTPICDNFDLNTGVRINLDDIFSVSYDEYSTRITQFIVVPETEYKPSLFPWYKNGSESIPMPAVENFMLTPNGLALIYGIGEIADMASRAVVLYVDYEDILDILSIEFRLANGL